ncbi:MAG: hypothetical protein HOW97_30355 [Catenulispora sp.]|nr:hypothetical protein [Catenulispora sp.]
MNWYPESEETLLYRGRVSFATGRAAKVEGMRWFRDEGGRDIAAELPGWPRGPVYTPRSDVVAATNKVAGGLVKGVAAALAVAISAVSSANPDLPGGGGHATDPAHEVEDFPVLVAAPGTIARTLPYQLDPDRRPREQLTELVVTDRRLLVLGVDALGGLGGVEVLWEVPRTAVASVVKHAFGGGDLTLVFADGSRARLDVKDGVNTAIQLTWELCPAKRVELGELALKKLKLRAAKFEGFWESVVRDDGVAVAHQVKVINGKQYRTSIIFYVTKWVELPNA